MKTLADIKPKEDDWYSVLIQDQDGKLIETRLVVVIVDDGYAIVTMGLPMKLNELFDPQKITKTEALIFFQEVKKQTVESTPIDDEKLLMKNCLILMMDKFYEKYLAES